MRSVQGVRLIDVFLIGPFLFYVGIKYQTRLPKEVSMALIILGALTIFYNGINFIKNANG